MKPLDIDLDGVCFPPKDLLLRPCRATRLSGLPPGSKEADSGSGRLTVEERSARGGRGAREERRSGAVDVFITI